jgi:hypothetical protein
MSVVTTPACPRIGGIDASMATAIKATPREYSLDAHHHTQSMASSRKRRLPRRARARLCS